jgi:hypothetical protein
MLSKSNFIVLICPGSFLSMHYDFIEFQSVQARDQDFIPRIKPNLTTVANLIIIRLILGTNLRNGTTLAAKV